ncbi:MAG: carbon-nitrogen hydrolase family protein [Planctomycetota bacterium]|jgi:agmatine deiminase
MTVGLISDVFYEDDAADRLRARLDEAKRLGAELAVIPECGCNSWCPATQDSSDDDAEAPGGPRATMQSEAARDIGIGLVGAAIVRDPDNGQRYNTALVFDASGALAGTYAKCHIPEEPGFWETSHYEPSPLPPRRIDGFAMPIGVQICSDNNRPEGCHLLGAQGVECILNPRAATQHEIEIWKPVWRANALTSCAYVLSVNRPAPEQGVPIGGASICVAPNGEMILETTDTVSAVTLDRAAIEKARVDYPGYLPVRARMYAQAWAEIASSTVSS